MSKLSNHKTLTRQWKMRHRIPSHGDGLTAAMIRAEPAEMGFTVTKRTVELDLEQLTSFFGSQLTTRRLPHGNLFVIEPNHQYEG